LFAEKRLRAMNTRFLKVNAPPSLARSPELVTTPPLSPKVAIMILNHNGLRWLPKCLASVSKTDYPNYEICLVDNGSTDGSVDYVAKNFPRVKLIQHEENLGFAEAYNEAIERVEANYLVLLNNDIEVLNPSWVRALVEVANEAPGIAAVACKMISMENHSYLDSVGGMGIPFWRGFVDIGKNELDRGQYDSGKFQPFAFCGGAALVKKGPFIEAGQFDGKFYLYVEDAELSWRLRLLGYSLGYAPEAKIAHYFGGTSSGGEISPTKLYYCHRNLLRAILKNCGDSLNWALRNYLLFSLFMGLGFAIPEPRKTVSVAKAVVWNLLNIKDTYRGRLRIRNLRRSDERQILISMFPELSRYQPAKHATLRRILNVLFEYSQRWNFTTTPH
jgi:GT2 family glycosyltransferase